MSLFCFPPDEAYRIGYRAHCRRSGNMVYEKVLKVEIASQAAFPEYVVVTKASGPRLRESYP